MNRRGARVKAHVRRLRALHVAVFGWLDAMATDGGQMSLGEARLLDQRLRAAVADVYRHKGVGLKETWDGN